jgi:hypothetical protein
MRTTLQSFTMSRSGNLFISVPLIHVTTPIEDVRTTKEHNHDQICDVGVVPNNYREQYVHVIYCHQLEPLTAKKEDQRFELHERV